VKKFIQLEDYFETGCEGTYWIGCDYLAESYMWKWRWPTAQRISNYFDPTDTKKYWQVDLRIVRRYVSNGYENMNFLEDGDKLTIFKDYSATEVLWQGVIKKETHTNKKYYSWISKYLIDFQRDGYVQPLRDALINYGFEVEGMEFEGLLDICKINFSQQISCNRWCHWLQDGVNPDVWGRYFLDRRYAYLERDEKE
jgi:hypothetical protein